MTTTQDDIVPVASHRLDIGTILSEAWNLLMRDIGLYIAAMATYFVIGLATCGLGILFYGPLFAGVMIMGIRAMKGESLVYADVFAGFRLFLPLLLLSIVTLLLVTIGLVLCILPGIYLILAWSLAMPLVIDRKMDFWAAMQLSLRTFNANLGALLLLFLLLYLINALGSSIPFGFLISQPLCMLSIVVAYSRLFSLQPGPVV
jgi:uncharacterized membrane protein